nr:replication protein [Psittaciform ambidensovirus]
MERNNDDPSRQLQLARLTYRIRRNRLAVDLCTYLNRESKTKHVFIKDIVPNGGLEEANEIIKRYDSLYPHQKDKIIIIGYHQEEKGGEHLHLYHSCGYNQSHCRCQWLSGTNIKKREPKHIIRERPFKTDLFENIIEYLLQDRRHLIHLQIGPDALGETIHRLKNLRISGSAADYTGQRLVENCELQVQDGSGKRKFSQSTDPEKAKRITRIVDTGYYNLSQLRAGAKSSAKCEMVDLLVKHLLQFLCTPIEAACQLEDWIDNKLLAIYDASNAEYRLACSSIMRMTSQLSFDELYQIHNANGCMNVYAGRRENYYYSREESLFYLEELLIHQYGADFVPFLNRLLDVTEKRVPKKNSMFIMGKVIIKFN